MAGERGICWGDELLRGGRGEMCSGWMLSGCGEYRGGLSRCREYREMGG